MTAGAALMSTAPAAAAARYVPILSTGAVAREMIAGWRQCAVAAVFARCLYLRAEEAFVCVGDASIGQGPLNLVVAPGHILPIDLMRVGQAGHVDDGRIVLGSSVILDLRDCAVWRVPAWPDAAPIAVWDATQCALASYAARDAPAEGLFRTVLAPPSDDTPFERAAAKAVTRYACWLSRALAGDARVRAETLPGAVDGLLGLGPGLTPSGDDFLVGALAILHARRADRIFDSLGTAIVARAPGRTSPLSGCFLDAAAMGQFGEATHRAVSSLIAGDAVAAVAAARSVGHSSGWDMLAGAVSTLDAIAQHAPYASAACRAVNNPRLPAPSALA